MEEVIWIEVLSHQHRVLSRQRVVGSSVTIGRAYDNDLVFDDPHMAARHLRLSRNAEGGWCAEDLGSVNGVRVDGERRQQVVLDANTALQAGHTLLRLRTTACEVAAELPLTREVSRGVVAAICLVLVFALVLLQQWLSETGESRPAAYLEPVLLCAIMAAVWTSAWGVLSRIFAGSTHCGRHLSICGVALLVFTVYAWGSEVGAFALSWTALAGNLYVVAWLIAAAACFAHLRACGRGQLLLKAASVIVLAIGGITAQSLLRSEQQGTSGHVVTLQRLAPPALRVVHAQAATTFFSAASRLRVTLDRAWMNPPIGAADGGDE